MSDLQLNFDVLKPDIEERIQPGEGIKEYVRRNSVLKVIDVATRFASSVGAESLDVPQLSPYIFLSADTVGILEGVLLEKPNSSAEAVEMLEKMSGATHTVMTAFSLLRKGVRKDGEVFTEVKFRQISKSEILSYVATGEPMDKAGAYGAQGYGRYFIKEIKGSYMNVVGLPISEVLELSHTFL